MHRAINEQLHPLQLYEALYTGEPRGFAIPVTNDPACWNTWRDAWRARLRERLGGVPTVPTPPRFVAAAPSNHQGYQRTYIEFESAPGVAVPAWLLVPTTLTGPAPAVIAVHGHGYGMDEVVGLNADGTERLKPQGYHQDFAVALCRRGMVVLVPELCGFGRRRELRVQADAPDSSMCHAAAWWGIMLGKPLLGQRVRDVLRAVDVLHALPEVDSQRIGIMGGSGGGAVTLFAAALDERFQATVISNYFCTFKDSILALSHCHCNYVPGLLQDGESYDIAALIAPRPLLIQAGTEDPIFPLSGVIEAYEHVRAAYTGLGAADQLAKDVYVGGHQIKGAKAYDFLWHWLTAA